ncbi:LysE family translocator [Desulfogranum mediterraneum]|uniref:LysE family translocator n=1 Tax=Desulfogranum mediterraneum TaxID=160661 RepID=UPI00040CF7C5|nr:LysE family translocator [Desulfogranum mediterraneum]
MSQVIDLPSLAIFIPTFFFVSATPGMCMTLSMTLGMTLGVRRTFWMMWGELVGVALVSAAAVIGVASVMLHHPLLFQLLKYLGGGYLGYLGWQLWCSRGKMAISARAVARVGDNRLGLALQGFVTAIANPKGWAFMISLLPPFINQESALAPQLITLLVMIVLIEFCCLVIYAGGGKTLRSFLDTSGNVRLLNRIAGSLMVGVGLWLALG